MSIKTLRHIKLHLKLQLNDKNRNKIQLKQTSMRYQLMHFLIVFCFIAQTEIP